MAEAEPEYDDIAIRFLQVTMGPSYLSPGGPDVAAVTRWP